MAKKQLCASFVRGASIRSIEGLCAFKSREWVSAFTIGKDNDEENIVLAGGQFSNDGKAHLKVHPSMKRDVAASILNDLENTFYLSSMLPTHQVVRLSNEALQQVLEFAEEKGLIPEIKAGVSIDDDHVEERLAFNLLKQELGM